MTGAKVFISYSHKDRVWKDRILTHLRPLEKGGLLTVFEFEQIGAGSDWLQEIEAALSEALVAILVVTADLLSSDFILETEIPGILARRKKAGLHVIPVLAKPCYWQEIEWLAAMQIRPLYAKPLASHSENEIDTQLTAIVAEVMTHIRAGSPKPAAQPASSGRNEDLQIAPLEANVDTFLEGAIATLDGFVLNSGRFLERYLEIGRYTGVHIRQARFILPSEEAIRLTYRTKSKAQETYLLDTLKYIETAWQHLANQSAIDSVEFRRIDCVPRNLCVIRNDELVLTGLYEPDHIHPIGLTCQRSWFHGSSSDSRQLCRSYSEWFGALWDESAPTP